MFTAKDIKNQKSFFFFFPVYCLYKSKKDDIRILLKEKLVFPGLDQVAVLLSLFGYDTG